MYLVEEPLAFGELLNHSLHMVMTTYLRKQDFSTDIRLEQIHVVKECVNLPTYSAFNLFTALNVVSKGLANFIGILTGYSDIRKSM